MSDGALAPRHTVLVIGYGNTLRSNDAASSVIGHVL
jgi:Ni,Fe-hydrogenase maturation factor